MRPNVSADSTTSQAAECCRQRTVTPGNGISPGDNKTCMELKEQLSGVPGMLRPFKGFLRDSGLNEGDQVVYYGCPGTCTPFIELLGFAVRDLPIEQVYVPYVNEAAAKVIRPVEGVGMQVSAESAVKVDPKVIVLMGGLSMPGVPVTKEAVRGAVATHPGAMIVGVCFMQMFEKMGWVEMFDFDLLIDASINPVRVWQ